MTTYHRSTEVQSTSGYRGKVLSENNQGVMTEKGLIPWSEVACFWTYSKSLGRVVSVPVN